MRCLNSFLESFYARYAFVVYRHAWLFIVLPLASTACFSVGFLLLNDRMVNDTSYLFTPYKGPNDREKAIVLEHWPTVDNNFVAGMTVGIRHWFYVVVTPKHPYGSLWNNASLDEILRLNDYIMSNLTLKTVDGSTDFGYDEVCMNYDRICFGNGHVLSLRAQNIIVENGGPRMAYPITREYLTDDASDLGYLLADVTVNETAGNTLLDVGAIRLAYFNRRSPMEVDTMSIQWRIAVQQYLLNYQSDLINLAFANEDSFNQGLVENSNFFAPQIAVTFLLMLTFTFLNSFVVMQKDKFTGVDWVRSKPLLAIFGVSEPGLAVASTIGFMLLVGMPYYPVLVAMPFLVFAIGVDDMFIMMSAWHGTKKSDPAEVRFSHALSEAAVSVTITSVSDILAFAIGAWNALPGVQLFCIYTSVAFFFELVYQCTFYAAAMAIFAKAECEGRHCITMRKALVLEEAETTFQRRFLTGTVVKTRPQQQIEPGTHADNPTVTGYQDERELNLVQKLFHKYYVPALLRPVTKILAFILFVVYLGFSAWGCAVMGNGLQPEKLMLKGHYSIDFLKSNYIWANGTPIHVVVSKPANVSTTDGRNKMLALAEAFENTRHSMGSSGTLYWLREYLRYLDRQRGLPIEDTQDQWCGVLQNDWLRFDTRGIWLQSIRWGNESLGEGCDIKAFRFLITTSNYVTAEQLVDAARMFRGIASQFSEYNVSIYEEYMMPYADQYMSVTPTMIRNGIIAIVTMIVLSMLMIPHPVCGIFITLATVSIDTGVSGFLAWWGVNMDGLSMMTMIMATGFAVDLSAHVSYAYIRSPGTPEERVRRALEELGWPVFQGVTSTLLGVLVLGTVDAYMYQTFFKTVFLVIIFGILHSLVFLPIALTVFAPQKMWGCVTRKTYCAKQNSTVRERDRAEMKRNGHAMNGQQTAAPDLALNEETIRPRKQH